MSRNRAHKLGDATPPGHRPHLTVEPLEDRWEPAPLSPGADKLALPPGLLFVTDGDVNDSSTPGLASWTKGTVVAVGDPNLALEPGVTGGTFSSLFSVRTFTAGDVKVDALHAVRSAVTVGVGAAAFALQPGDLLLSLDKTATLTGLNALTVQKDDVLVFRPAEAGNYSAGHFYPLLDDFQAVTGGGDTRGIALVEAATTVGDVTLPAGSFLYVSESGNADVRLFRPSGVGAGTTSGTTAVLLAGQDIGIKSRLDGVDLVETTTTLGGRTLAAGTLLVAVDGNEPIGTTDLRPTKFDMVALAVTKTTLGGGPARATASTVFEGADVGLKGGSGVIRALSLTRVAAATTAAADDTYTTSEDMPLTVPAADGVLANDTGTAPRSAEVAGVPAHGVIELSPDGAFSYTPDENYFGTDRFTYTLTDGTGATRTATVVLTVAAVNDPPTFSLGGNPPAVDEGAGPQAVAGFAGGIDAGPNEAGQTLTFRVVGNTNPGLFAAAPAVAADGRLTYTPAADASGEATVTVVLQDDGGGADTSAARSFKVVVRPVNDAPTLAPLADVTLAEDTVRTVALSGVTAGGGESQRLRITAVSSDPAVLPDPIVGYASPAATGTLALTSAADASGTATVTVTVRDAGPNGFLGDSDDAEAVRQFVVTVTPVPDPPVARPDTYSINTLVQLLVAGPGVLANDTDPDGDALTAALLSGPSHGILLFRPDGSFTYTSVALYQGVDTFTYKAVDATGNATPTTVTLNVGLGNRPPVARADAFFTSENGGGFENVLANDTDPDGDTLTALVDVGPAHGTFDFRPDGTFEYRPFDGFTGTDSFDYTVYDGRGGTASTTATITVRPVNDPPAAADDTATVAEGGTVTIDVRANDTDADGDPLTVAAVTQGRNGTVTTDGAAVTYTPDAGFSGTDTFAYAVTDGNGGVTTARVRVVVTPTDGPPTLDPIADVRLFANGRPRAVTLTGISAGTGDSQPLTVTAVSSNPAVVPNPVVGYLSPFTFGALTVAPRPDASGTAVITVTVSDGSSQVSRTFTVTVVPTNAGPTITPIADVTVLSGETAGPLTFAVGDAETPADALTVTAASRNTGLVPNANITVTPTGGGGRQITVVPAANATGAAVIVVTVSDGVTTRSTTFAVRVTAVAHDPTAAAESYTTAFDTPLAVPPSGLLDNDADADGDVLTAMLDRRPAHGRVDLNPDGSFVYSPDRGFAGTDTFTYRAVDATRAASAPVAVTIHVEAAVVPVPTPAPPTPPEEPAAPEPPTPVPPTVPTPTPTIPPAPPTVPPGTPAVPVPPTVPRQTPTTTPTRPTPPADTPRRELTTAAVTPFLIVGGPAVDAVSLPVATTASVSSALPNTPSREAPPARPVVFVAAVAPAAGVGGGGIAVGGGTAKPASGPKEGSVEAKPAVADPPAVPPPTPPVIAMRPPLLAAPLPTPAALTTPAVPVPDIVLAAAAVSPGLDKAQQELTAAADQRSEVDAVVSTAAVLSAGYVLLNTRAAYWFLSALLARPAVWRRFDPIEVIYSWEQEQQLGGDADPDDDSLQTLVN